MVEERVERRLTTILAADVVGYSRLVGLDEEGTIARLKALREELIDPTIAKHRGRIVMTAGDGFLAEFPSVVGAVRNAVEMLRALTERNAGAGEELRIEYRVGINLGDIVIDGDDILGDGVNIAARLESLANPGGICISGDVFHLIEGKLDLGFEDMGEQWVKNIEKPVRVYRVLLEPEAAGTVVSPKRGKPNAWRRGAIATVAATVVAVAAAWWRPWAPAVEPAPVEPPPVERVALPAPDKLSIAVLPFDNLSDDKSQEYFADGMAADIITDLSKLSALFVVARDSSFRYKAKTVDLKQVGRELGAKYLLEGSVRRAGGRVRINAQLIDAETGRQIWAERYDGEFANTFELQDKVTGRIIEALSVKLGADERVQLADHGTNNFEAHDAYLRGQSHARRYTAEGFDSAIAEFERALELDPSYDRAATAMEQVHFMKENSGLE